jgi:hypothetical protein
MAGVLMSSVNTFALLESDDPGDTRLVDLAAQAKADTAAKKVIEGVPDLSVSGDKSDLVVVDPHDPTTTSETRSANAIADNQLPMVTNLAGARSA